MGLTSATIEGSEHDVVFSHDPDVIDPTHAGWIRRDEHCKGVRPGADVLTIRQPTSSALASILDVRATGADHSAHLVAAHHCVLAIGGVRKTKAVKAWIEAAFRTNPEVIAALEVYLRHWAQGHDPVEVASPIVEEVFGALPTFLSVQAAEAARRKLDAVDG